MEKFVTFVLDQSGSMSSIKDDTIGGYNSYLDGLRQAEPDAAFTLILFDSNKVDLRHRAIAAKDVPALTPETYIPGASTPLIDACMKAIKATEEKAPAGAPVVIVIQTDGQENASTQFTRQELIEAVSKKTAEGWLFVFIGAGIDAFAQASSFGFAAANTMSYGREKSASAFNTISRATRSYMANDGGAAGAAAASFTDEEREDAADNQAHSVMPPRTMKPIPLAPARSKSVVSDFKI